MKEFVNEYTFGEELFTVSGDNGEYSGKYGNTVFGNFKGHRNGKYIFIFQTPSCALVLEKSTVVGAYISDKVQTEIGAEHEIYLLPVLRIAAI